MQYDSKGHVIEVVLLTELCFIEPSITVQLRYQIYYSCHIVQNALDLHHHDLILRSEELLHYV